jgi:hypothetical protein
VRRAALALLSVVLLAAAGCGDDDGGASSESARQLVERGFATDVDSGLVTLEAGLELEGGPVEGPFRLELEGPFRAAASPTQVPDLAMEFHAEGMGREYEGRATLTRENGWVEFQGETYEIGEELWAGWREAFESQAQREPQTFAELGIDPLEWLTDLEEAGEEEMSGTTTTKVTGRLDAERMLRDFNQVPGTDPFPASVLGQIDDVLGDVGFETWIGDDDIWRRISVETDFRVPEAQRDAADGLEGGTITFDLQLDDPNEPVEIETPADARPIDELLRDLGIPPELFYGPGFATPTPG